MRSANERLRSSGSATIYVPSILSRISLSEHEAELSIMQSQKAKIVPELCSLESLLSCSIENVQRKLPLRSYHGSCPTLQFPGDTVLLRFTNIDEANASREFSIVLDLSQQKFKGRRSVHVAECPPEEYQFPHRRRYCLPYPNWWKP